MKGKGAGMIGYVRVEEMWLWLCTVPGVVVPWWLISMSVFHHFAYSWMLKCVWIWLIFSRHRRRRADHVVQTDGKRLTGMIMMQMIHSLLLFVWWFLNYVCLSFDLIFSYFLFSMVCASWGFHHLCKRAKFNCRKMIMMTNKTQEENFTIKSLIDPTTNILSTASRFSVNLSTKINGDMFMTFKISH